MITPLWPLYFCLGVAAIAIIAIGFNAWRDRTRKAFRRPFNLWWVLFFLAAPAFAQESYGGPVFLTLPVTGYDYKADAKYTRQIYVWIMPAEFADGTPTIPQQLRSVRITVSLQSVPAIDGALCDPQAVVTYDEGTDWIQGCLHGNEQEPTPLGVKEKR